MCYYKSRSKWTHELGIVTKLKKMSYANVRQDLSWRLCPRRFALSGLDHTGIPWWVQDPVCPNQTGEPDGNDGKCLQKGTCVACPFQPSASAHSLKVLLTPARAWASSMDEVSYLTVAHFQILQAIKDCPRVFRRGGQSSLVMLHPLQT